MISFSPGQMYMPQGCLTKSPAIVYIIAREGDELTVGIVDHIERVSISSNEVFGSEYAKIRGRDDDYVISSPCYLKGAQLSASRRELAIQLSRAAGDFFVKRQNDVSNNSQLNGSSDPMIAVGEPQPPFPIGSFGRPNKPQQQEKGRGNRVTNEISSEFPRRSSTLRKWSGPNGRIRKFFEGVIGKIAAAVGYPGEF